MGVAGVAEDVGKGLLAGLVGTVAMTVSSTLEAKLRNRGGSDAPATAAGELLGIESFTDDDARSRFSQGVHWAYGTGWGAVRGLLGAVGLSGLAATSAHFAVVWGTEQALLPALDVAPPATQWGAEEVGVDVLHHVVYAAATGFAYEWLDARG